MGMGVTMSVFRIASSIVGGMGFSAGITLALVSAMASGYLRDAGQEGTIFEYFVWVGLALALVSILAVAAIWIVVRPGSGRVGGSPRTASGNGEGRSVSSDAPSPAH